MFSLFRIIDIVLTLYIWAVVLSAVLSWLVAFNVVNQRNPFVYQVGYFLERITEPLLRPLRSIIPPLGGVDITPLLLILILFFLRSLLTCDIAPALDVHGLCR